MPEIIIWRWTLSSNFKLTAAVWNKPIYYNVIGYIITIIVSWWHILLDNYSWNIWELFCSYHRFWILKNPIVFTIIKYTHCSISMTLALSRLVSKRPTLDEWQKLGSFSILLNKRFSTNLIFLCIFPYNSTVHTSCKTL